MTTLGHISLRYKEPMTTDSMICIGSKCTSLPLTPKIASCVEFLLEGNNHLLNVQPHSFDDLQDFC